jgi:DNA repair protein RadD
MTQIVLRPDQEQLKQGVYQGWRENKRAMLAVLSTGGGKSVIMSDVILERHMQGAWQCVSAHRNELVTQLSMHVARRGIQHRIIASRETIKEATAQHREEFNGKSFVNPDSNTAVASVPTLNARAEQLSKWAASVHNYYGDEAHHYLRNNSFGDAWRLFPNAWGMFVTATPSRADGMGLGSEYDGIMDDMVVGPGMRELINLGALSDYEIAIPASDFVIDEDAFDKNGELSPRKGREASKRSHIVGDVVTEYQKRALGKKFICFATDVETANEMAANFNAAGITCAAVSAKTPTDVRNEMIRRFKRGQLMGLVNVDLFGEGFDVPAVEVVIMARPTGSLAVFLQQFGRALRVLAGKLFGLVIDHVGNWKRHGFPDKKHPWTLARREKKAKKTPDPEEIPLTSCRECSRPYERFYPACPYCGAEPPLPDPVNRKPEQVEGDLLLLTREMIAQMQAATELESPASIAERVEFAAGPIAGKGAMNRQIAKLEAQERLKTAIAQWAGIQRHKGRSDAESYRRFFIATGMDVLTIQALDDRAKYEEWAEIVEGWCVIT